MQNEIWGVAAIGGIIAAAWNYVKSFARQLSYVAFERVTIGNIYSTPLREYLMRNTRSSPLTPKYYRGIQSNFFSETAYGAYTGMIESVVERSRIGWLGWRAMYIDVSNSSELTLTWLRGMFTIAEIERLVSKNVTFMHNRNLTDLELEPLPSPAKLGEIIVQGRAFDSQQYESMRPTGTANADAISGTPAVSNTSTPTLMRRVRPEDIIGDKRALQGDIYERSDAFRHLPLSDEEIAARDIIRQWYVYRNWYRRLDLSHRIGMLFHGQPGTGKSTFAHALAFDIAAKVHRFDLATLSNREFTDAWPRGRTQTSLVLFEDFDNVFNKRDNIAKRSANRDALTFDTVLNTITTPDEGHLILIVTANNVDAIDEALGMPLADNPRRTTRPGRLDYAFEFKPPDDAARRFLATRMLADFSDPLPDIDAIVAATAGMTGAAVTEYCRELAMNALQAMHFNGDFTKDIKRAEPEFYYA